MQYCHAFLCTTYTSCYEMCVYVWCANFVHVFGWTCELVCACFDDLRFVYVGTHFVYVGTHTCACVMYFYEIDLLLQVSAALVPSVYPATMRW